VLKVNILRWVFTFHLAESRCSFAVVASTVMWLCWLKAYYNLYGGRRRIFIWNKLDYDVCCIFGLFLWRTNGMWINSAVFYFLWILSAWVIANLSMNCGMFFFAAVGAKAQRKMTSSSVVASNSNKGKNMDVVTLEVKRGYQFCTHTTQEHNLILWDL